MKVKNETSFDIELTIIHLPTGIKSSLSSINAGKQNEIPKLYIGTIGMDPHYLYIPETLIISETSNHPNENILKLSKEMRELVLIYRKTAKIILRIK